MIALIDYGLGNIRAFLNVFAELQVPAIRASSADAIGRADKLILPGVGAFDHAMERLEASGLLPALTGAVLGAGVPVLGVCVGLQMLARGSEEGDRPGLGWVRGVVRRLGAADGRRPRRVPHMGWNDVEVTRPSNLFRDLDAPRFYFLHSYHLVCEDERDVLAVADYEGDLVCAVGAGHVYGVQFHPEKSHQWGKVLLRNFAEL